MQIDSVIADLMSTSGDQLLRLAYQLCHDRAGAEDLVQEALTRVYGSWLRRAPQVDHAEAYVRRAIVNEYLRKRRLRASSEVISADVPDFAEQDAAQRIVDSDEVWQALGALPARQRAVLVLRFYADLPDAEIAAIIGARGGTVRSLASRGLDALRAQQHVKEAT